MTFTQFIASPDRTDPKPSFLALVRHHALWPAHSNRLEDFESFLLTQLEDESEGPLLELRDLWRAFAQEDRQGRYDLDLAVAAWGDYARHVRSCSGTESAPCEAAQQFLERALDESRYEDHPMRAVAPCGDVDSGSEDRDADDEPAEYDYDPDDREERRTELF